MIQCDSINSDGIRCINKANYQLSSKKITINLCNNAELFLVLQFLYALQDRDNYQVKILE